MISCEFEDGGKTSNLRHVTADCIVIKNHQVLLGKRSSKLLEGGKWGLLGGYMNRDETATQAAQREVMEESGWEIKNLRLLRVKDYPDRPKEDRQNISFVYVTDAVGQTGDKDWENDEIRWFDLDKLPAEEMMAFDHLQDIMLYKAYLNNPFPIPFIGQNIPK